LLAHFDLYHLIVAAGVEESRLAHANQRAQRQQLSFDSR
jgi:hypothetical protein